MMNERLKMIRSDAGMNQADFAKALGIGQSTLAMMEVGKREILDRHVKTICSIFRVNEEWLRTGNGDMFIEEDNALISQLAKQYNLDDFSRKFIETYVNLPEAHRAVIKNFAQALSIEAAAELSVDPAPEVSIDGSMVVDPEIASELSDYAQELEQEKRVVERSSASGDIKGA